MNVCIHNLSNNVQISQVSSTSVEEVQRREDNLQESGTHFPIGQGMLACGFTAGKVVNIH